MQSDSAGKLIERIDAFAVKERCAKSHALANIPSWSAQRPAFPIRSVLLPASLAALATAPSVLDFQILESPRSLRELARAAIGNACILDPGWIRSLKLRLADLRLLARAAYIIIDLPTLAGLLRRGTTSVIALRSRRNIMAGRIEYADVATRGLALQDVVPYGTLDGDRFGLRCLSSSRAWRTFADQSGFATIISSETPDERTSGHVLSAAQPFEHGELIACDLPWIAAGVLGPPLAPRMTAHLLQMMLNGPLLDGAQNWSDWDDSPMAQVLIRDIADLARRFPPLQTARWEGANGASLGLTLAARNNDAAHLVICTGRVDPCGHEAGLPAEPLMGIMKLLSWESRTQTAWWRKCLSNVHVTWQFEAHTGLKYAVQYEAAHRWPEPTHELDLRSQARDIRRNAGLLGDGSIAESARLTHLIRDQIERIAAAGGQTRRNTRSA